MARRWRVGRSRPSLMRQTLRNSLMTCVLIVGCCRRMPSAMRILDSSRPNAYTRTLVSTKTGTVVQVFSPDLGSVVATPMRPEERQVDRSRRRGCVGSARLHGLGELQDL